MCGCAKGADDLGLKYAKEFKIPYKLMPADWKRHGRQAGFIRNAEMANVAQALIAFWDYESPGTKHMIEYATKKNLRILVVGY